MRAAGRHDSKSVRRIAKAYAVNRGIRRIGRNDKGAAIIADKINEARTGWPQTLTARADLCCRVAKKSSKVTNGVQVSGVTKLMWFLEPNGWTVFDKLAADGLGIKRENSTARSKAFYQSLTKREFKSVSKEGNKIITGSALAKYHGGKGPILYMERVLDTLLLLNGTSIDQLEEDCKSLSAYITGYAPDHGSKISRLADDIIRNLGENPLGALPDTYRKNKNNNFVG